MSNMNTQIPQHWQTHIKGIIQDAMAWRRSYLATPETYPSKLRYYAWYHQDIGQARATARLTKNLPQFK